MAKGYVDLQLTESQRNDLQHDVLSHSHPLGNSVYEFTNRHYDPDLYQYLFNWHPDHLHEDAGNRPALILGRRGAGKSSYLNYLAHKDNVLAVPVKSWEVIDLVDSQVREILNNQNAIDAEKVADIWHLIFLTLATRRAYDLLKDVGELQPLLHGLPFIDFAKKGVTQLVSGVLNKLKEKYLEGNRTYFDIETLTQAMGIGYTNLDDWETTLSNSAQKAGKIIILLIDNPERLEQQPLLENDLGLEQMYKESTKSRWMTYAGLLTLLAHFNEGKTGVQARYCVPAEQYFFLQDRSAAILKDFTNIHVLHWSSGDLLSALAHRFMVFLQLNPQLRSNERYLQLKSIPIYTREGAFEFFREIFGNSIVNYRGYTEDTVTYLLRHTQLLPRQLLIYINAALKKALAKNVHDLTYIDSTYIKVAIKDNEELCATEIIDSYKSIYPEGKMLVDNIDNFPIIDTVHNIKTNWASLGAKKILSKYKDYPGVSFEADRFIRFLSETGVIGRISIESLSNAHSYINAEFEYTLPHKLNIKSTDKIAVHPIFSMIVSPERHKDLSSYIGIYPKGIEEDFVVDRDGIKNRYIRH